MISLLKSERIEKTAKSIEEAKGLALKELGLGDEDVEIEVVDEGNKGFLGIGSKEAKIAVTVKNPIPYAAKKFLSDVFAGMKLEVNIETTYEEDNLLVELSGDNMGIVIGKRGDTLDSLQYLTSLVVNRLSENYCKVTLDTENYRQKRLEALESLSKRLADKVAKTGKKYTLEPMNPYERRIIHSNLQDHPDVTTFSVGEDPYRKVVIAPKNPQKTSSHKKSYSSKAEDSQSYISAYTYTEHVNNNAHNTQKHASFESYLNSTMEAEDNE